MALDAQTVIMPFTVLVILLQISITFSLVFSTLESGERVSQREINVDQRPKAAGLHLLSEGDNFGDVGTEAEISATTSRYDSGYCGLGLPGFSSVEKMRLEPPFDSVDCNQPENFLPTYAAIPGIAPGSGTPSEIADRNLRFKVGFSE